MQEKKVANGFTEAWFRGVHSDVGGGNGNRPLNAVSLHWMFMAARRAGLPISDAAVAANLAVRNAAQPITPHKVAAGPRRKTLRHELLHISVQPLPGRPVGAEFLLSRIGDEGKITQPV